MNNLFNVRFCRSVQIRSLCEGECPCGASRFLFLQNGKFSLTGALAFFLLFFNVNQKVFAQEIQINEDPRVSQLVKNWTNGNWANPRTEGWRVQIMASPYRQQVEDGRNLFRVRYPDVPAEWTHEKPYYKLRVGAFRNKLEALAFIASLTDYAGAYPIKEANIHPRDFLE